MIRVWIAECAECAKLLTNLSNDKPVHAREKRDLIRYLDMYGWTRQDTTSWCEEHSL